MGRCVIIFDHKPDHQNHHEENPEAQFPSAFSIDRQYPAKKPVRYWTLDESDPNRLSKVLGVKAQDLDPEILAGTIFYRPDETNQAETFAAITIAYGNKYSTWTIQDFISYIQKTKDQTLNNELYGQDSPSKLNTNTMQDIRNKLTRPGRIPSFVDPRPESDAMGQRKPIGNINDIFQPGLNVIRISESHKRGYALFLARLLRKAEELRSHAIQKSSNNVPELEVVIDEASDIFKANSRHLRDVATGMLTEQIRKGRSLHIGYVIAVQNAGDVPEDNRQNLNTTIIGRHRNLSALRDALPTSRPGMLEQADKLNPGEMFVDMFGVRSLLLVQMDLSRSKLTVAS